MRWRSVFLAATLAGTSLAGVPARAHDDDVTQNDPHKYGEPHAGWKAPPRAPGRLAPDTGALFGSHSDDDHNAPLTAEHQKILETEAAMGRRMDIDNSYYGDFTTIADDWEPGNPDKRGLSKLAYWDVEQGRIPLVGWACGDSEDIAAGKLDDVIRKTGEAFKAFGHEFFMRYCWEMDGSKRIGSVGQPEDFVAAWRRIHDIIVNQVGAQNVVWVWCGNANSFKNRNDIGHYAWDYYPGDDVVDWVSADGYNWGASKRADSHGDRWRGFIEIYDEFMVWARSTGAVPAGAHDNQDDTDFPKTFPNKKAVKPIMIGEYGVQEPDDHTRKAVWAKESHEAIRGDLPRTAGCAWCGVYSDIAAMVYFDVVAVNGDWRILSGSESTAAFREQVNPKVDWFNQIHTIGWAPARNRPDAPPPPRPEPKPVPESPEPGPRPEPDPVTPAPSPSDGGYWMVDGAGNVYAFGDAEHLGDAPVDTAHLPVRATAVDIEPTVTGHGYWVLDAAGYAYRFGDAAHRGDFTDLAAGEYATSLSATPSGNGYWVFTNRGRVASFGDATSYGDMSAVTLNGPVLDSIPTPSGRGYYMVGSDGGIFAFGDAVFHGSMGSVPLNAPVQSLVPDDDGAGYWLVASDGGVFAFDAPFQGSMGATPLNRPVTGMVSFGDGYLMVGEDGGIFNFSSRRFHGSMAENPPAQPVASVAALHR